MRHPVLACLVCLACLACPGGDDGTDTEAATTAAASETGATSTGDPDATAGSAETTASSSTGPDEGSGTGPGLDPVGACMATCEHLVECGVVDVPNCGIPCATAEATTAGCESEYVAQQACAVALSCDDAQAWADAMGAGGSYPCGSEDAAFGACQG